MNAPSGAHAAAGDERPKRFVKVAMILADEREVHGAYDAPLPWFGPAPSALLEGLEGLPDTEVHMVTCTRRQLPTPVRLASNVVYHSTLVPKLGWLRTLYAGCIWKVRRLLRTISPDIVHAQGTERHYGICAAFSNFPSVLTIHGNMRAVARAIGAPRLSFHGITALLEGWTIPRVNGVICLSSYTAAQVAGLARKTWAVSNAVPERFFQTTRVHTDVPEIVCVARVCNYKNQNNLIRALDPLATAIPFRLVFAGGEAADEYAAEFRRLVAARDWCHYAGTLGQKELLELYARATINVLPTLEDNCPMVILEAAAAGVPSVASRIGGVPDLIEAGVTGLLFDPNNPDDIRRCIETLLRDPAHRAALGAASRVKAERESRPREIALRHLEVYRDILSRR